MKHLSEIIKTPLVKVTNKTEYGECLRCKQNIKYSGKKFCSLLCSNRFNRRTHGESHTPFWEIWFGMIRRCKSKINPHYGGRGIQVCDRWKKFENFKEDMFESYEFHKKTNSSTSIDRIEVNGHYEPKNCKWSTNSEQHRNQRPRNGGFTLNGISKSLVNWCDQFNVKYRVVYFRIYYYNWKLEDALTTPVKFYRQRKSNNHE